MVLNEFLKEHKKVEEQQATIAELKSTVAQQQNGMEILSAQLKEQAAQIQKVNARLEVSKPAAQFANYEEYKTATLPPTHFSGERTRPRVHVSAPSPKRPCVATISL